MTHANKGNYRAAEGCACTYHFGYFKPKIQNSLKYVQQTLNTNLGSNLMSNAYVKDKKPGVRNKYVSTVKHRQIKRINNELKENLNEQFETYIVNQSDSPVHKRPPRLTSADQSLPQMKYFRNSLGQLEIRPKSVHLGNF